MKDPKGTALITGASAGIGEQLARCFAKDGHDVILVARRAERLKALATQLETTHQIKAQTISHDLGVPGAGQALLEQLQALGVEQLDYLINNAGIGHYGNFAQGDHAQIMTLMHLNISTLVELTHLVLPGMIARGRGRIMNVGSVAGFQPGPNMAVYYASKAFVYSFTEALVEELRSTPVTITNLAPGATKTEFSDVAQMNESWLFAMGAMGAQEVAQAGYKGLMAGKSLVIPGVTNKIFARSSNFAPRALVRRIAGKVNTDKA